MAMCSAGIGRVAAAGRWTDPLSIIGSALGVAALVVIGAALLGRSLPAITTTRHALFVVLVIIVVKVALTALHRI
jgi:choline-glycine betaine transporter